MPFSNDEVIRETETVTDPVAKPFTAEHFARWLTLLPADTEYDSASIFDCLVCRYGKAHGVRPNDGGAYWNNTWHRFSDADKQIVGRVYVGHPHNYAGALSRAQDLIRKRG